MLGIVSQGRIHKRRSYDSGLAVSYYGYNGWICDSDNPKNYKSQGNGFKEGDTVTVTV